MSTGNAPNPSKALVWTRPMDDWWTDQSFLLPLVGQRPDVELVHIPATYQVMAGEAEIEQQLRRSGIESGCDAVVFTSQKAVVYAERSPSLLNCVRKAGRVEAISSATARALAAAGISAGDRDPAQIDLASWQQQLAEELAGKRILLPGPPHRARDLPGVLQQAGCEVMRVDHYQTHQCTVGSLVADAMARYDSLSWCFASDLAYQAIRQTAATSTAAAHCAAVMSERAAQRLSTEVFSQISLATSFSLAALAEAGLTALGAQPTS